MTDNWRIRRSIQKACIGHEPRAGKSPPLLTPSARCACSRFPGAWALVHVFFLPKLHTGGRAVSKTESVVKVITLRGWRFIEAGGRTNKPGMIMSQALRCGTMHSRPRQRALLPVGQCCRQRNDNLDLVGTHYHGTQVPCCIDFSTPFDSPHSSPLDPG